MNNAFVYNAPIASAGTIRPLYTQMDSNGCGWLKAVAKSGTTRDYPYKVGMSTLGWAAEPIASASNCRAYIGYSESSLTSGQVGRFMISGFNPSATRSASASLGQNFDVCWDSATIAYATMGTSSVAFASAAYGAGVHNGTSTTAHAVVLYGIMPMCKC